MEVDSVKSNEFTIDTVPNTNVEEGLAQVNFPSTQDVFYNPVQEFNRDMSILVIRLHTSDYKLVKESKLQTKSLPISENRYVKITEEDYDKVSNNTDILPCGKKDPNGIKVLEALAASGLRSIRYAKEIGGIKTILANDISKQAIECININIDNNNVTDVVQSSLNDASLLMYQHRGLSKRFEVIDLDPYGSPHTFLDSAVQSVVDGGLLLVTSTDMAVLCGNSPETCYLKYGALSMKHKACHEIALRLILQCIEANANKYGRYIVPLLSMSVDFYCRVFVRIFTSQKKCKETCTKLSWFIQCSSCESTSFQPLARLVKDGNSVKYHLTSPSVGLACSFCGGKHRTGGPIWTAPIHDINFVNRLKMTLDKGSPLNTSRRIKGVLSLASEELPDVPLYIVYDKFTKVLKMGSFKMKEFISALLNAGYKVSSTHASKNGIKTNAPYSFLWSILRARERIEPINIDKLPEDHPAHAILRQNTPENEFLFCSTKVNFEIHPNSTFESKKLNLLRFQKNPTQFWGPKARAVTSIFHRDEEERNQKIKETRKKMKKENPGIEK